MSFNLVDLVKDQVKGQLIGHMGNLLGNEGGKATSAVDGMIPALLNGMTGSANNGDGADKLFGAIQDQDDSLLDNMGSLLGGGQASTVIDNGNSVLSNLFGSGGLGKLAGALSAFSGVSKGGTSSLMGMLAPIVLGVLKRKVMGDGLNAGSLASMLTSQGNNISAAMPQGLGDQLNSSGFLSSIGNLGGAGMGAAAGAVGAAAAGASSMASGVTNAAGNVVDGAKDAAGNAVSGARDAAGNVVGGARDAAGNAVSGARDAAGNVVDGAKDAAGNAVSGARDAAGNVVGGARDAAGNVAGKVGDGVSGAAGATRDGVHHASNTVEHGAKKGGSMFRWLLPLIILGALAWAAFKFLLPGAGDAASDAADAASSGAAAVSETASDAVDATKDAAEGAVDATKDAAASATESATDAMSVNPEEVTTQVTDLFGNATETLGGISDIDSAKAALPALGELGTSVDSVTDMIGKVPDAARGPISSIAEEGMGKLQPIIDKVMAIPGVGAVLQPVMEPIMEKLQELG